MKHIKKYNESKKDYNDLVTSFIDEVSAVFDNDKWGIISHTIHERVGGQILSDYHEFKLKDYQTYPDIVTSTILENFDSSTKYPFISIGIQRDNGHPHSKDIFLKINEDIKLLNNIKKLLKNLEYLNIYVPFDYEYVSYDLLSLRIDLKWHLLKSL